MKILNNQVNEKANQGIGKPNSNNNNDKNNNKTTASITKVHL